MAISTDWKMGKFQEWYTEFPFLDRSRKSPIFVLQNVECRFHFSRNTDKYYTLHLKPKTMYSKLIEHKLEPFQFIIYSNYSGYSSFNRSCVNFSDSNTPIYCFHENHVPDGGANFSHGYFARFFFVFENGEGPLLPLRVKTDERCTQTFLMSSLRADVQYLSLDLDMLLKSGRYSDVQLRCNGGNIRAHKAILAARSKVFFDMFQEVTSDNQSRLFKLVQQNTESHSVLVNLDKENNNTESQSGLTNSAQQKSNENGIGLLDLDKENTSETESGLVNPEKQNTSESRSNLINLVQQNASESEIELVNLVQENTRESQIDLVNLVQQNTSESEDGLANLFQQNTSESEDDLANLTQRITCESEDGLANLFQQNEIESEDELANLVKQNTSENEDGLPNLVQHSMSQSSLANFVQGNTGESQSYLIDLVQQNKRERQSGLVNLVQQKRSESENELGNLVQPNTCQNRSCLIDLVQQNKRERQNGLVNLVQQKRSESENEQGNLVQPTTSQNRSCLINLVQQNTSESENVPVNLIQQPMIESQRGFVDLYQERTSKNRCDQVNFPTTEISVMKLCLEYIYTGNISKLPVEMASDLYVLGRVLKILPLTKMCSHLMICNSSKDNYIQYLVLADKHDDDYLKCALIDYISEHAELLKKRKFDEISK